MLSPGQVIQIAQSARDRLVGQINDIKKEIKDATTLSILSLKDKEILNEEGLPIKEIREDVFDEHLGTRAVLAEEPPPTKIYTMAEIDKMMDEAIAEEQAELSQYPRAQPIIPDETAKDPAGTTAVAGQGLEVGTVSGEELLAKLMDDSKQGYDPVNDTWIDEDTDESAGEDDDGDEDEDEFGRTRGMLIPDMYSATGEKSVKFAAFEQPKTPSVRFGERPIKSAMKKMSATTAPPLGTQTPKPLAKSTTPSPAVGTQVAQPVAWEVVEHTTKEVLPQRACLT
jgi:hypothetical protein